MSVTAYTPEILAYPYNIASEDDEVRRESIAYIERNIWIAAQLEAPVMLLSPGWGMWDPQSFRSLRQQRQGIYGPLPGLFLWAVPHTPARRQPL